MSRSQTDRPGFAETLRALNGAQKPGHGVPAYTRWVNRRAARVFAAGAVALGIGPNGVTAVSALLSAGAIAVLLLADPTVLTAVIAALLFALGYAMDSADGQVARVTGASSPGGEWLDHVVDSVRVPAIHLTVAEVSTCALSRSGESTATTQPSAITATRSARAAASSR